jgi:hypothetical protein
MNLLPASFEINGRIQLDRSKREQVLVANQQGE